MVATLCTQGGSGHVSTTPDPRSTQHTQFGGFSYKKMTVMEAVDMLDDLVDESDPDVNFPNSFHAFQTAEGIRKVHPDKGASPCCGGGGAAFALEGKSRSLPCPTGFTQRSRSWVSQTQPRACSPALAHAIPMPIYLSSSDWFHLVGLLHDLGKVLALWGEPQVRVRFVG
jgi:hypothetical protein